MKTLSKDYTFYAFSGDLPARLHVSQNELFVLESCDCFSDQLNSDQDTLDSLDWDKINPATGPVAIAGVKPGDIVRIDIQKIEFTGRSVMTTIPGSGVISGITEPSTRVMDNSDGVLTVVTDKGVLSLPIEPMIGVIGLAPAEGSVPTGTPGKHGGNMDCKLIGEGAKLYLEAAVDGGLFGCGDVHALMGDGEVLVCGAETPARITLSASILNEPKLRTPFIETDSVYASVASAATTEDAYKMAVDNMFDFLTSIAGLSEGDAGRLMSLVGNLKFCQVVDPEVTVRFEFPKEILTELGFKGFGA